MSVKRKTRIYTGIIEPTGRLWDGATLLMFEERNPPCPFEAGIGFQVLTPKYEGIYQELLKQEEALRR